MKLEGGALEMYFMLHMKLSRARQRQFTLQSYRHKFNFSI